MNALETVVLLLALGGISVVSQWFPQWFPPWFSRGFYLVAASIPGS